QLSKDFDNFKNGLVDGFKNMFKLIGDAVTGGFNTITGLFTGFWDTLVQGAQGMSDALVGHSIIPDMINSIISWFTQLPGRAMGAIQGLAGQIGGFFSGLASQAVGWGQSLIQGV